MSDRPIVLAGADAGLPRALALHLAATGHPLRAAVERWADALALRAESGRERAFDAVDLADDLQAQAWAESVLAGGPPRLLVVAASPAHRADAAWRLFPDEVDFLLDRHLRGAFNLVRHLLPAMLDAGSGAVVLGADRPGGPGASVAAAVRGALDALATALADEVTAEGLAAPGVIVCAARLSDDADPASAAARLLALGPADHGRTLHLTAG